VRVRTRVGLWCVWILLLTSVAGAETVEVGANVKDVDTAKHRGTIQRGTLAGLHKGDTCEVFARRTLIPSDKIPIVRRDLRLARGTIVEITDSSAVLALDAIVDKVEVDSHAICTVVVADALADSNLFRVLAAQIELLDAGGTPFVTIEQLVADPSSTLRDKTLDAMIADLKSQRDKILPDARLAHGHFEGRREVDVFDALDRTMVDTFLAYFAESPRELRGAKESLFKAFHAWANSIGEGAVERRARRLAGPPLDAARKAAAEDKLDEARRQIDAALAIAPNYDAPKTLRSQIEKVELLRRRLASDPDDTPVRAELVRLLYDIGAYAQALAMDELLLTTGFDPIDGQRMRGYLLAKLERWNEAEQAFQKVLVALPTDPTSPYWLASVRALRKIDRAPRDPAAHLELAAAREAVEAWTQALDSYRRAAELAVSAKQRETVKLAQERILIMRELTKTAGQAKAAIRNHSLSTTRLALVRVLQYATVLRDDKRAAKVLRDLADSAEQVEEFELWIELLELRARIRDDDHTATLALAIAKAENEQLDDAERLLAPLLAIKKYELDALRAMCLIARSRGKLDELEKLASRAAKVAPKDSEAARFRAVAAAGRDDWDEAIEHARKAFALADSEPTRIALAATSLGQHARDALLADSSSARERLRLVRALANLGLTKRAGEEIAKLPATGSWQADGWWAIASTRDDKVPVSIEAAAGRKSGPTTPFRKRVQALLEARDRFRKTPSDEANRIELARLYLQQEYFDRSLAVLGPLVSPKMSVAVSDLVRDGRAGKSASADLARIDEAIARRDFDRAMTLATAALEFYTRLGALKGRILSGEKLIRALAARGRLADAIKVAESSSAAAIADGEPYGITYTNQSLGQLRDAMGVPDVYRVTLDTNLASCRDLDFEDCVQTIQDLLADVLASEGRYADALDNARKAWATADRIGNPGAGRNAHRRAAAINLTAGRIADAEQLALTLLADSRKASDYANERNALLLLGAVATMRGQSTSARKRFQEVYELGTRSGSKGTRALARQQEGVSWLTVEHNPANAITALTQAATLFETFDQEAYASTLVLLGHSRRAGRDLAGARKDAERALELARQLDKRTTSVRALALLAEIAIDDGRADDAQARAKEALALATQTDANDLLTTSWYQLARAYRLAKRDQDALDAFEKAIDFRARELLAVGGDSDRSAFLNVGDNRSLYKHAVEHMLAMGKNDRAMEVLELSRDATVKTFLDPTKVQTGDATTQAQLATFEQKRARMSDLERKLAEAKDRPSRQRDTGKEKALATEIAKTRQELADIALALRPTHPSLYSALAMDPYHLADHRADLPKGSVVVEYFTADDALYAFVISAALAQPSTVRVNVTSAELAKTVVAFREAIIAENGKVKARDKVEELGRKLDDWLLEPLRKHIDGASTLIVLPVGSLSYLPFDALVVSKPGAPVRYAIEDFRISFQSATTFAHLLAKPRPARTGALLAVANPDGTLPWAQREVGRIRKDLPDSRVLGKKDGTIKQFSELVGRFRIVHLATHGIVDPDPRKSYLKLSDGTLTITDIVKLQGLGQWNGLGGPRAGASAVDAGGGAAATDGPGPLARAFAMAGAPALVASLWEVGDESTAELMATFYRSYEAGKGDRLDALRDAKLNLLRAERGKGRYAQPWHWASFQMLGDFRAK